MGPIGKHGEGVNKTYLDALFTKPRAVDMANWLTNVL